MSANTDITHSFSRAQAKQYGVNGAILLRYLINRIKSSANFKEGRRWFYDSVADLKENYPYLSQTAVNNARLALTADKGPIVTGNYNKWPKDKTTWYAVRDDRTLQAPEDDLLYFKVSEAQVYGIVEAVLLTNLRYWVEEKQKDNPGYQYHAMSPRKLAEVFQGVFSRNSIHRALEHLVKVGILLAKPSDKPTDPIAYRFAGPEDQPRQAGAPGNEVAQPRTGAEGGPKENDVAQNTGRGPAENTPGPTENIPGPTENKGGPKENEVAQPRSKVAQLRTTIPINNSLEDYNLKERLEERLKEDRFKASSVGVSSISPPDAALMSSQSGPNSFVEPIAQPAVPDSALTSQDPAPNHFVEPIAGSVSVSSPSTPSLSNQPPAPVSQPFSASNTRAIVGPPIERHPIVEKALRFLDMEGIHKCCCDVMKCHDDNTDPIYQDMADTIMGVTERLIGATDPAEIYRLVNLPDQVTLNGELYLWSGKFFEDVYDQHLSKPECPDNAHYREMFLSWLATIKLFQ